MRKIDRIYTYAATAFVIYNNAGCPSSEDFIKSLPEDARDSPIVEDIKAVNRTLEALRKKSGGDDIVKAVLSIYRYNLNNLGARIKRHSFEAYADIRTVYRWLECAREEFARQRGLDNTKMK